MNEHPDRKPKKFSQAMEEDLGAGPLPELLLQMLDEFAALVEADPVTPTRELWDRVERSHFTASERLLLRPHHGQKWERR